jgi:Ni,Fe-hydrogenase III small subunit
MPESSALDYLQKLPVELMGTIAQYLTPGDIHSLRLTSSYLRSYFSPLTKELIRNLGLPDDFPLAVTKLTGDEKDFLRECADLINAFKKEGKWRDAAIVSLMNSPYLLPKSSLPFEMVAVNIAMRVNIIRGLSNFGGVALAGLLDHFAKFLRTATDPIILSRLRKDLDDESLSDFLGNPYLSEDMFASLLSDPRVRDNASQLELFAGNLNMPTKLFARLVDAAKRSVGVLVTIAKHPLAPQDVLIGLATNERHQVRAAVARNHITPGTALTELARDDNHFVRVAVAGNPATPREVLENLHAIETNDFVLWTLASNPNAPVAVLEALRPSAPGMADKAPEARYSIFYGLAANSGIPVDILNELVSMPNWYRFFASIVKNPKLTADMLATLAGYRDEYTLVQIIKHPNTSVELMEQLLDENSGNTAILAAAAAARNTPEGLLDKIAAWAFGPNERIAVLVALAGNNRVSDELFARLAAQDDVRIKRAIAGNSKTPIAMLATLAADPRVTYSEGLLTNRTVQKALSFSFIDTHLSEKSDSAGPIILNSSI